MATVNPEYSLINDFPKNYKVDLVYLTSSFSSNFFCLLKIKPARLNLSAPIARAQLSISSQFNPKGLHFCP